MKVQEVILRAVDGRLKWYQAAEILGISDRQMRRGKQRYEQRGYDGLFDWRRKKPSPKRVPRGGGGDVLDWIELSCLKKGMVSGEEAMSERGAKEIWVSAIPLAEDSRRLGVSTSALWDSN